MPAPEDAALISALRRFAAAMLGLAAHELNNRLAVMRETVGLMEDLARAGKAGATGTARAHSSLQDQIGRTLNVVRTLSALGGALDEGPGGFDPGAALEDLLGLTERWARQQGLQIRREIAAGLPRVDGDPGLFLCLAYRLLEACAAGLRPGGSIVLRAERDGAGVRIGLHPAGEASGGSAAPDIAADKINHELARRLGGELVFQGGDAPAIRLGTFH